MFTDSILIFGHLSTAKLGAIEQHWAAQLVAFNYELMYQTGTSNRNADALSWQYAAPGFVAPAILGTPVPVLLQQPLMAEGDTTVLQAAISFFSQYSFSELQSI